MSFTAKNPAARFGRAAAKKGTRPSILVEKSAFGFDFAGRRA
jgi:hypothetical protein